MNSQAEEKSEAKEKISEEDLIDKLLTDDTQQRLVDYFINTLFKENTKFTEGLTKQDYDIILSSLDAEGQEIFHSLNICNCKYSPESTASRKVIHYEDLEKIMTNFLKWKNDKEKEYKDNPNKKEFSSIYMHAYPMLRKNLQFDINSITFKEIANNKELKKYAIICKYALLATIVAAIILYISHSIITGKRIDYQTTKMVQGSAFVTYLCINIIGIIHTIIIFVKNRDK